MYHKFRGELRFLECSKRTYIYFRVERLATYLHNSSNKHVKILDQIIKYLKKTRDHGIPYKLNTEDPSTHRLMLTSIDTELYRSSYNVQIYIFFGSLISWTDKRKATVEFLTCKYEYFSESHALQETIWLQKRINGTN